MITVPAVRPEQTIRTGAYVVSAREPPHGARGLLPATARAIVEATLRPVDREAGDPANVHPASPIAASTRLGPPAQVDWRLLPPGACTIMHQLHRVGARLVIVVPREETGRLVPVESNWSILTRT
jgi:hypothetical protein